MHERQASVIPTTQARANDPTKWQMTPELMHFLANSPGRFSG